MNGFRAIAARCGLALLFGAVANWQGLFLLAKGDPNFLLTGFDVLVMSVAGWAILGGEDLVAPRFWRGFGLSCAIAAGYLAVRTAVLSWKYFFSLDTLFRAVLWGVMAALAWAVTWLAMRAVAMFGRES